VPLPTIATSLLLTSLLLTSLLLTSLLLTSLLLTSLLLTSLSLMTRLPTSLLLTALLFFVAHPGTAIERVSLSVFGSVLSDVDCSAPSAVRTKRCVLT
jgi:hypothetical protein